MSRNHSMFKSGQTSVWFSVGAPIVALMLLISVYGFGLLSNFAKEQDQAFADNTKVLVDRSLKERIKTIATLTSDYSEWDAAYQAVSVQWDQKWVEENIYVTALDSSMIFNPQFGVRYHYTSPLGEKHAEQTAKLAKSAEVTNLANFTLSRPQSSADVGFATIIETAGDLAVVYMAPFRPTGKTGISGRDAPRKDVAIMVSYFTPQQLSEIAQSIDINGFRYIAGSQAPKYDATSVVHPVQNHQGNTIGWFAWQHEIPGTVSFKKSAFAVFAGLALLCIFSFLLSALLVRNQLKILDRARQAAEDSNRVKSQFLSNMSHELRTPLNSVIGYAEIIQEDVSLGNIGTAAGDAGRIQRSASHLLTLINDLLDHSKIEAGKMDINPEMTDLSLVVDEVVEFLSGKAAENSVSLVINCDPTTGQAFIDPIRFKQCLLNLVGNAVKFTSDGTVTLAMRPVTLESVASFRVSVTDTGIGMNSDALQRLFNPFEQADGSTTRQFGGTGLGLSITKYLVEAMNGRIEVESEAGKGSVFTMIFPLNAAVAPSTDLFPARDKLAA